MRSIDFGAAYRSIPARVYSIARSAVVAVKGPPFSNVNFEQLERTGKYVVINHTSPAKLLSAEPFRGLSPELKRRITVFPAYGRQMGFAEAYRCERVGSFILHGNTVFDDDLSLHRVYSGSVDCYGKYLSPIPETVVAIFPKWRRIPISERDVTALISQGTPFDDGILVFPYTFANPFLSIFSDQNDLPTELRDRFIGRFGRNFFWIKLAELERARETGELLIIKGEEKLIHTPLWIIEKGSQARKVDELLRNYYHYDQNKETEGKFERLQNHFHEVSRLLREKDLEGALKYVECAVADSPNKGLGKAGFYDLLRINLEVINDDVLLLVFFRELSRRMTRDNLDLTAQRAKGHDFQNGFAGYLVFVLALENRLQRKELLSEEKIEQIADIIAAYALSCNNMYYREKLRAAFEAIKRYNLVLDRTAKKVVILEWLIKRLKSEHDDLCGVTLSNLESLGGNFIFDSSWE
ncbi:hypothetical protein A2276_00870 [candidate division WOR-1 bacterium RIFOXYA12_FULL_43_27]|uniref:Uncharacterized protein n=1 Tax=candidate division WOR-1 bacterium RIFOXYC2_FULL_46_14 TaxID=1802587 RepID=A0A1F4U4L2_UNCSA|nr:MAG: hypothetical protein A2276_00870 [candidate division WOR-1 bacterium RIFOXYA12_FULL_43_27]OGC20762.1 MAG: hypothetical protein A2292_07005 [candidate division WOR-1 bacterium RIFOXYB2_FULL_46_45]OGC31501.1 MAG: hypothetical protein A2232_04445 [candidate division WOR-1 bacterium RIFOXYA2_FULL_46_56]OGC39908.1 MAG: hypothetical protein A2438_05285 [candidate division WOR-1 bacterium RIFOXYC2_FULL_46_14]